MQPDTETVWRWLDEVPDPEIPVISITELGIIRDVEWQDDTLVVTVTPTYSGCPATSVINLEIERKLRERGIEKIVLKRQISPPWSTDWIAEAAKEKLRAYGIAPPIEGTGAAGVVAGRVRRLTGEALTVPCPRCGSPDTQLVSQFGSTPCKAAYQCRDCLEPFDYFKCI